MHDPLRWYRAVGGAMFGGLAATVLMLLGIVERLFGGDFDYAYGEPLCYALFVLGTIVGFLVGQRPPRRHHEQ